MLLRHFTGLCLACTLKNNVAKPSQCLVSPVYNMIRQTENGGYCAHGCLTPNTRFQYPVKTPSNWPIRKASTRNLRYSSPRSSSQRNNVRNLPVAKILSILKSADKPALAHGTNVNVQVHAENFTEITRILIPQIVSQNEISRISLQRSAVDKNGVNNVDDASCTCRHFGTGHRSGLSAYAMSR